MQQLLAIRILFLTVMVVSIASIDSIPKRRKFIPLPALEKYFNSHNSSPTVATTTVDNSYGNSYSRTISNSNSNSKTISNSQTRKSSNSEGFNSNSINNNDHNDYNNLNQNNSNILRVLQFNILADGLSGLRDDNGKFNRVNKKHLDWNYRKKLLLKEIQQYNPDIITLQEVDHYHDYFYYELSSLGYSCYYAPKPTSACLEVSDYPDGCALFVNTKKLKVISVETKTLALSIAGLTRTGELIEDDKSIMTQNQVGLIAICELIHGNSGGDNRDSISDYLSDDSNNVSNIFVDRVNNMDHNHSNAKKVPPIIIATTHLKSSKTFSGERYRQKGITQILNSISKLYKTLANSYNNEPVVILTGDFNAVTDRNGYEPLTYRAVKSHPLKFRSVYNEDVLLGPNSLSCKDFYTTWKSRKNDQYSGGNNQELVTKRCIDYIFYTPYKQGSSTEMDNSSSVIAESAAQVAIASLLRFSVYFFGAVIPASSLISSGLLPTEKCAVVLLSVIGLITFEFSSVGSVFKPQVGATVDLQSRKSDRGNGNSNGMKLARYGDSKPSAIDMNDDLSDRVDSSILDRVASLSQVIQPLPQAGRPGLEALTALDIFSEEDIGETLIPSENYPSDHLAIVADLKVTW